MAERKSEILVLIAFIIICQFAGIIGSVFTFQAIPAWYASLQKPSFAPPGLLIGIVWVVLYFLMAISAFLVWRGDSQKKAVRNALAVFGLQLIINTIWSIAFFGLRSPLAGMIVILALWLSIAVTIAFFLKISRKAAWLLAPYLAWVSFAAFLNYTIMQMN